MEGLDTDISTAVAFITRLNAVRALALASFVILIYDHVLSLRREISHVWPLRFSLPKLLFLLTRYCHPLGYFLVLLSLTDPSIATAFCGPIGFFAGFYNAWILAINGTIGTIRTWALFGRSPTILAYSAAFVMFQVVLFSVGMSLDVRFVEHSYGTYGEACLLDINGKGGIGKQLKWIAVFLESGPLALVAWRTRQLSQKGIEFPLVQLLYRDCSIALILFFVGNFTNYLAFSALAPVNMIFTHPITTSILTRLVLNMHELFYKQSLADLDVNSHEAPLDPDTSDLGLVGSNTEWICDCPPIFDEAETLTEEIGATTVGHDASLRSDPEKANNRQRCHTETCRLQQQRLNLIISRHNATKSNYQLGYYRRPRAKHLESMAMTFETMSEDPERSPVRTVGTVRGAIFGGMLLGLEVTTPGTGLTRTPSNHSSSGLSLFGSTGWGLGSSMSRNSTVRRSNRQSEPLFSKRSPAPASRIGHARAASTSDGHVQPNLLHPNSSSTIRVLPSPPVRKLPSLPASSGTISSNSSRRRSTITFSDDISTGPLTASSYSSLATPMAPTTSKPKLRLDVALAQAQAQAQVQRSRKRSRTSLPTIFVAPMDAPPLPNTLPVPPRSRSRVKGTTRPLPILPSLPILKPLSLPETKTVTTQSQEQHAVVCWQDNEAELPSRIGLSSAQIRLLPLPPTPPLTDTPIRRLPILPQQEEASTPDIIVRSHSPASISTIASDGNTTVGGE